MTNMSADILLDVYDSISANACLMCLCCAFTVLQYAQLWSTHAQFGILV